MNLIDQALIEMIRYQSFLANIAVRMNVTYTDKVQTAGVTIKDGLQLYINPTFFKSLNLNQQQAVLVHETYHIALGHIVRGLGLNHKLFNIAADLAINQMIKDLPEGAITFEMMSALIPELEPNHTAEYYYDKLKTVPEEELLKQFGPLDDHTLWEDIDPEYAKEIIKEALNVAKEAHVGNIPGAVELFLQSLNAPKKNWKSELKRFVANQISINREPSRKVRNRRYGLLYPGSRKEEELHLMVAVDTSGSVSDDEATQFFSEILAIYKNGARITLVQCDTEIHYCKEFNPNDKIKIVGRGGTRFSPVFEKLKTEKVDGLIYLTDGEAADDFEKPQCPVLWALSGRSDPPVSWGARIRI